MRDMILDDLLRWAKPLRDPIRASGRRYALAVETRLDVSARHLSTVELGRRLEPSFYRDGEALRSYLPTDHGTVITAAQTLVFGGAQACLDLCGSALIHWHGHAASSNRDFDIGDLTSDGLRRLGVTLEPWAVEWRNQTKGDARYTYLDRYRGAQIHRIVRRSSTVRPGRDARSESWLSTSDSIDPDEPVEHVYGTFVRRRPTQGDAHRGSDRPQRSRARTGQGPGDPQVGAAAAALGRAVG
jgi:hypothetical protein